MNEVIQLRDGARVRVEEFPPDHLTAMHRNLDMIRDERPSGNERFVRIISHPVVAAPLTILAAVLIGLATFHDGIR